MRLLKIAPVLLLLLLPCKGWAQTELVTPVIGNSAVSAANPVPTTAAAPAAGTAASGYPPGATAISGNSTGSTGAVTGTLTGVAGKFTYICGFNVSSIGGTASSGPVVVAGLVGSSQTYQVPVNSATNATVLGPIAFSPCIQSSAVNTSITVTTTANGTATAVDVNSWGYLQ